MGPIQLCDREQIGRAMHSTAHRTPIEAPAMECDLMRESAVCVGFLALVEIVFVVVIHSSCVSVCSSSQSERQIHTQREGGM